MKFTNGIRHYPCLKPLWDEGFGGGGGGGGNVRTTLDLLEKVPNVAIYGFLLTSNPEHALSELIRKRWYELHNLTGTEGPNQFLLIVFEPPFEMFDTFKDYWKQQLGDSFEKIWNESTLRREPGRAFNYLKFFENVGPSQFPCLVLFTDLNNLSEQKIVLRTIPDWDRASLFEFLSGSITLIKECCKLPIDKRMNCLENSLTSPSANAKLYFTHTEKQVTKYMKENPAIVVKTAIGCVAAFATANMLPLGATAIAILKKFS